jgi:hypothetical protein
MNPFPRWFSHIADNTCVFYSEPESVYHLFYGCVVAKRAWQLVSKSIGFKVGVDYESIAKLWLCNKKFGVINMFTSAVSWCLWKLRNDVHFQGVAWIGMKLLWDQVMPMLQCWKSLVRVKMVDGFDNTISSLENCDRTTSKMRGLSPKIISGDS